MKEIWKDIENYEGYYQVSNFGRVRSLDRIIMRNNGIPQTWIGRVLIPKRLPNGYLSVRLLSQKERKTAMIHRLVASAFIPNPNDLPVINHKDENKENNYVENLEWCTQKYNVNYGNGRKKQYSSLVRCGWVRKVYQFTLDGIFVNEFNSIREATEVTGITNISSVCLGKHSSAGGFMWSYNKEPQKIIMAKNSPKRVCLLSKNGQVLEEYSSLREAAKAHNITHRRISVLCKDKNSYWKIK
jgi:hypothetical protein